MTLTAYKQ
jgi:hypothetical protein